MKRFTEVSSGKYDEARKNDFTPKFTTVSVNGKEVQNGGGKIFFLKKGDNVELTCKCGEKDQYGQLGFSINQKISNTDNYTTDIALDESLIVDLKRTYSYDYTSTASDNILKLTIPLMEYEDSGNYICRNRLTTVSGHIDDVIKLAVLNNEESLRFIANGQELSNTLEISEKNLNSNVNFTCGTISFPKPSITIYQTVKGNKKALPNLKVAIDNEIVKSNKNKYYSSIFDTAVYVIHKLSADDYDTEFGCESVNAGPDTKKYKNIRIELPDGEPIIIFENMENDVKTVTISKENTQYIAVFHVLSKTSVSGHIMLKSKDSRQDSFNVTIVRKLEGNKFELTIRIPSLQEWHLVADGMLHVTNDRGTTTEKIQLDRRSLQLSLQLKTNIDKEEQHFLDLKSSNLSLIEIICEAQISDEDKKSLKNFVIAKKCLPAGKDGKCILDKTEDISAGEVFVAMQGNTYNTPARYSLIGDEDNTDNTLREVLVIDKPQPEDGGTYQCKIPRVVNPLTASATIPIYYPKETFSMKVRPGTSSDKMYLYESYNEEESLIADENDKFIIDCSITKTFPLHEIDVLIDDKPMSEAQMGKTKYKTFRTLKDGVHVSLYSSSREVTIPFKYEYDGKSIKCAAYVKGAREQSLITVGVKVGIQSYKPKFICDSVQYAESNTKNWKLKCQVISKPSIREETAKFAYTYDITRGKANFSLGRIDNFAGHYIAELKQIENNLYEMILRITRVTRRAYTDYYFEIANQRGKTVKHIVLKKTKVSKRVLMNDNGSTRSNYSFKCILFLVTMLFAMQ
ncbi:DgyrCDS13580 [Dimorphilus gyrociliatus]|uniref:DgyrCDS13580 n=1 Tax=Dimorphilus gyrociliatus TaxID=2664684 RepID=A0A7I8WB18_9ANNE|nr:DgyrCDS13580 [Dimorphilus gyrociliatus]